MVTIQCINPNCTAPERKFEWDERQHLEADGKVANKGDKGAVSFIVDCPFCGTQNKVWVVKLRKGDRVTRGFK